MKITTGSLLVLSLSLGCGSESSPGADASVAPDVQASSVSEGGAPDLRRADVAPACWPDNLNADAGAPGFSVGQYVLDCTYGSGVSESCVSNEARCSASGVQVGTLLACTNRCVGDEYGLVYGYVGPGEATPLAPLPAGCRAINATSAGPVFYCCPCTR
jgi:hypothetical protein